MGAGKHTRERCRQVVVLRFTAHIRDEDYRLGWILADDEKNSSSRTDLTASAHHYSHVDRDLMGRRHTTGLRATRFLWSWLLLNRDDGWGLATATIRIHPYRQSLLLDSQGVQLTSYNTL